MANQGDNQVADEQNNSHVVYRNSFSVLNKLRRPTGRSSTSSFPKPTEVVLNNRGSSAQSSKPGRSPPERKKFAFPTENSENWSRDAVEFYLNGDSPFCYSRFLGEIQLPRSFWGSLLGYESCACLNDIVNPILLVLNFDYTNH